MFIGAKNKKILCLIPTFNNGATIERVVLCCKNYVDDILVINDGSGDNTASILKNLNVLTITNELNLGKGASLKLGFIFAAENKYDIVVMLDGDGEHEPCDIPVLLYPLLHLNFQVAFGSRDNRLLNQYGELGSPISPGSIAGGLKNLKELFQPVYDAFYSHQMTEDRFHNDESSWKVFESIDGKAALELKIRQIFS